MKTAFDSCGGLFHASACAGPGFAKSAVKSAGASRGGWKR